MKPNTNTGAASDRDDMAKKSLDLDQKNQQGKSQPPSAANTRGDANQAGKVGSDNQDKQKVQNKNNPAATLDEEADEEPSDENMLADSGSQKSGINSQGDSSRNAGQSSSQEKTNQGNTSKEQR